MSRLNRTAERARMAGPGSTPLRRAEARAALAERRLEAVVDAIPEGIVLLDAEGRYVLWNARYSQIYHRSADLLAPGGKLIDALRVGVARGDYPEAVGREEAWLAEREHQLSHPRDRYEQQLSDGSYLLIEDRPMADGGTIGLRIDVTAMKRQALALEQAAAEAEAANDAKSEFLANVSHEIRTPLHGILGMAQVLERDATSKVQRSRAALIRQSGDLLLALLNDVLDLAKIEAGKLGVEQIDFSVEGVVETACAPFQSVAVGKGVRLEIRLDPSARRASRGDPLRLQQIVANLVSNALKFTERGAVSVAVSRQGDVLSLRVTDSGIGMEAATLEALFAKFTQADSSCARRFGGTGLGLAISRQLAELMGGALTATSQLGVGSTFHLVLPIEAAEAEVAAPGRKATHAPIGVSIRILAAEDNPTNQLILKALLEPLDVALTLVPNGREATEAYASGAFDLVLMDIQMPEVDGVTAAKAIRACERANGRPRVPIVALSANAMDHQVMAYRAAGMDDVLSKPFSAERLYAVLQALIDRSSPPSDLAAAG